MKKFYRTFFSIYVALVLQNVVTLSVNLADNIMLGGYSETALAGVAAVNQVQFIYQQILFALGDGVVMFCSQYWGQKKTEPMKKISSIAMHFAIGVSLILFAAVSLFPRQIMHCFTTDEPIVAEGMRYLAIIRFTYLFFAITQLLLATLRSIAMVKIAFMLSVQSLIVNCCINYVLIYGKFGAPRLGVVGAAIGTLTARILELTVLVLYIAKKEKVLNLRFSSFLQTDSLLRMDYIKTVSPMVLISGLWGLNTAMQTVILGHMTSAAIAANSIASNLFLLVKSIPIGASATGGIMIGKAIGEGDMAKVRETSVRLQKTFLCLGIFSGILLLYNALDRLQAADVSDATRQMADSFLKILCIITVGMSYQMPTNNGIIRGGGNSLFVVRMDLISIWGIVIPLSLIMAFVVKASPITVVWCLNADQLFKCVPAFLESNYGNWVRKLTR